MAALTAPSASPCPRTYRGDDALDDPAARTLLTHLRIAALECRVAARADLFEACALLSMRSDAARTAHAEALMKCLPQATGKTPKILRPGEDEITFDEAWILRLATAIQRDDPTSAAFLLRSRVDPWARRNIGFLVGALARHVTDP